MKCHTPVVQHVSMAHPLRAGCWGHVPAHPEGVFPRTTGLSTHTNARFRNRAVSARREKPRIPDVRHPPPPPFVPRRASWGPRARRPCPPSSLPVQRGAPLRPCLRMVSSQHRLGSCPSSLATVPGSSAVSALAPSSRGFRFCRTLFASCITKKPAPAAPTPHPHPRPCCPRPELGLNSSPHPAGSPGGHVACDHEIPDPGREARADSGRLAATTLPDAPDDFSTPLNTNPSTSNFRQVNPPAASCPWGCCNGRRSAGPVSGCGPASVF